MPVEARRYAGKQKATESCPENKNAPNRVGAQIPTEKVYYNSSPLSRKIRGRKTESA